MDLREFNKTVDRFVELFEEKRSNYGVFRKEEELQQIRKRINKIPCEEYVCKAQKERDPFAKEKRKRDKIARNSRKINGKR